jgi:diadenosine tetraphosphatase ApaH/serine/threonine PP2A family protein phosphatase
MGNHDWYMASGGFCPRSKAVNDCLEYQRKVITQKNLEWLRSNPVQRFVNNIHMVHGGWSDPIDEYLLDPSEGYFSKIEGEIFVSGHTHIQRLHIFGNKTYFNPGSVGQPRDRNSKAAFAILEKDVITLHRVEYDMDEVYRLMNQAGFRDSVYDALTEEERIYVGFRNR